MSAAVAPSTTDEQRDLGADRAAQQRSRRGPGVSPPPRACCSRGSSTALVVGAERHQRADQQDELDQRRPAEGGVEEPLGVEEADLEPRLHEPGDEQHDHRRERPRREARERRGQQARAVDRLEAARGRAAARTAASRGRRPRCSSRARGGCWPESGPPVGLSRLAWPASAGEITRKPSGSASSAEPDAAETRLRQPGRADRRRSQHRPAGRRQRAEQDRAEAQPDQRSGSPRPCRSGCPARPPRSGCRAPTRRTRRRPSRPGARCPAAPLTTAIRSPRAAARQRARANRSDASRHSRSPPATRRERAAARSRAGRRSRRPRPRSRRTARLGDAERDVGHAGRREPCWESSSDTDRAGRGRLAVARTRARPTTGWLSAEITR